jgi:hypothetical protein
MELQRACRAALPRPVTAPHDRLLSYARPNHDGTHHFEVHEMHATTDLDIALDPTSTESIEQATRILIRDDAIPGA